MSQKFTSCTLDVLSLNSETSLLTRSCALPRPTTVDLRFKMVTFDSDEQHKHAVDATIGAMEGATGTSQRADQPSVLPA